MNYFMHKDSTILSILQYTQANDNVVNLLNIIGNSHSGAQEHKKQSKSEYKNYYITIVNYAHGL